MPSNPSILLIRHAPAKPAGFLYGRTDPSADTSDSKAFDHLAVIVGKLEPMIMISSPAKRCQQTAEKLIQKIEAHHYLSVDDQLWEQDFGVWDGLPFEGVPDIGELTNEELARYDDHGGESFEDVCKRVWAALTRLEKEYKDHNLCIVAHAGVLRAASVYRTGRSSAEALMYNPKPLEWIKI